MEKIILHSTYECIIKKIWSNNVIITISHQTLIDCWWWYGISRNQRGDGCSIVTVMSIKSSVISKCWFIRRQNVRKKYQWKFTLSAKVAVNSWIKLIRYGWKRALLNIRDVIEQRIPWMWLIFRTLIFGFITTAAKLLIVMFPMNHIEL